MPLLYNNSLLKTQRRTLRKNQTDVEKLLWSKLRNRQCAGLKFFRQYSVGQYILDFYCPAQRLAIELDGGQHAEDAQHEYDKQRSCDLEKIGIRILRFWNNDVVRNMDGVMETILKNITPSNSPLP